MKGLFVRLGKPIYGFIINQMPSAPACPFLQNLPKSPALPFLWN